MPNTQITIVGNLAADPEMRFTPTGTAVATFNVGVANGFYDRNAQQWKETGTTWYRVNAWRYLAEHAAESLVRGNRVVVTGSLASRQWETKEGETRYSWEITADEIGAALSFATVKISRATREEAPTPEDPWSGNGGSGETSESAETQRKTGAGKHGASRRTVRRTETVTTGAETDSSGEPPF